MLCVIYCIDHDLFVLFVCICMCMEYDMVMYVLLCTIVYILSELLLVVSCV